ncbi:MAG: right-handed parallel beta-helix repeat-containing protein [Ignavibacteriaceae bacterium]
MYKNFVVLIVIIISFVTFFAFPKTYKIDKNNSSASDANTGTIELPLKTIQKGIDLALAGDTVLVMPGLYNENLIIKRSGNVESGYIVIKSFKKYAAVIDGSNISKNKLIYWHGKSDGGKNKDYIIFDGFEVLNARSWAFWIQGDYNIFENLKVHETGKTAVQLITGSHNKFINNEIFNTGWNGISWEANNGGSEIRTDSNLVEGNYIHDLKYHVAVNGFPDEVGGKSFKYGGIGNIILNNVISHCLEGIYLRYEKNFLIEGNLIENINKDGIFLHYDESDKDSYVANGKIINNTITHTGYNGISNSNAQDIIIANNVFYNIGDSLKTHPYYCFNIYWYPITSSSSNIMNANLYYSNNGNHNLVYLYDSKKSLSELRPLGFEKNGMQINPKFVDAVRGNYALQANSPAIDAGIKINDLGEMKDINSVSRPQGKSIDIGAFEFVPVK